MKFMEDTNLKWWNKFNFLDGFVESLKLISDLSLILNLYNEEFVGFLIVVEKTFSMSFLRTSFLRTMVFWMIIYHDG